MTPSKFNNALRPGEKGLPEAREDTLDWTDRLPPLLRRLMKAAPFDYAVAPWVEDYLAAMRGGSSGRTRRLRC
jgi:hypothetical protein